MKKTTYIYSALANNTYATALPHIRATGFRSAILRYIERDKLTNLAEDFLVNSYMQRQQAEIENSISAYLSDDGVQMVALTGQDDLSEYEKIPLPASAPLDLALGEALVKRRSIRTFTGEPISLAQITSLMQAMNGVSVEAETVLKTNETVQFHLRTAASAGGLYPIEIYMVALNTALEPGIYKFQPIENVLVKMAQQSSVKQLLTGFSGAVDMVKTSHASLIFLFVAQPWRTMRKYGTRGLRFALQEIGAISQNLNLAVTALGLGSIDCASYFENEVNAALKLDGVFRSILHTSLVGTIA